MKLTWRSAGVGLLLLAACEPGRGMPEASTGAAPGEAERACIRALERQNRVTGVTVIGASASGTGVRLLLDAPNAERPWACVATSDGKVQSLEYQGEG